LTLSIARFVALMFFVTLISRGQTRVQSKWFSHPQAPLGSSSTVKRSANPRSRLSNMKRAALTSAAGPMYEELFWKTGHEE
jgi:hypothetical protein